MQKYYLDSAIWLDHFEDRNVPNLPKGDWAHNVLNKITREDAKIIYSDLNLIEIGTVGYSKNEIENLFRPLKPLLIFVYATDKQIGKAKDLAAKRNIPRGDALNAIIARDNKAILVTLDKHFQKLLDIIKPVSPKEFI